MAVYARARDIGLECRILVDDTRLERTGTAWTSAYAPGERVVIPSKNGGDGYVADGRIVDEV